MKGDINLKINKKIGLGLIGAVSLFAMADFVSLVDHKSAGGITVIEEKMTVGSVVLRMDDTNPADIYGGTWELITGDASLTFGNGSNQTGVVSGDNDPIVPLIEHSHTMNHDHPSVNTNTDTHSHTLTLNGRAGSQWTVNRGANWGMDDASPGSATATTASDSHYHSVNLPNYTGNTGKAGQSNATLDVRGARIAINVWKRIG